MKKVTFDVPPPPYSKEAVIKLTEDEDEHQEKEFFPDTPKKLVKFLMQMADYTIHLKNFLRKDRIPRMPESKLNKIETALDVSDFLFAQHELFLKFHALKEKVKLTTPFGPYYIITSGENHVWTVRVDAHGKWCYTIHESYKDKKNLHMTQCYPNK